VKEYASYNNLLHDSGSDFGGSVAPHPCRTSGRLLRVRAMLITAGYA